jgi:xanthine dehydrogenase YagR molybdenum-binding subunit
MPETKWPDKRRLIGTKVPKVDGPAKSTGTAKYSYDVNRKGMLHALILRCPHAHARITKIDTSAAERTIGFKGLFKLGDVGKECMYAGDEILGIAADTEEHAMDCIRAVKIEFEVLEHLTTEADALKNPSKKTVPAGNVDSRPQSTTRGNADEAFKSADAVVEGFYGVPVQTHVCFETHGMVAEWEGDDLTVWASTQAVPGTASELETYFKGKGIAAVKAKCITHYMGGGYGCKFNIGAEGRICAELARSTKSAVRVFLDRAEEHISVGNRPSAAAKVKIAGTKDGKITAFAADSRGTPGYGGGVNYHTLLPYVYVIPNVSNTNTTVRLNAGGQRAMRAPGHPQACFITEAAVDDLCHKLNLDPMQVRLRHLPGDHRKAIYEKELAIAGELSNWSKAWHAPGKGPSRGPVKHGLGLALHTWGGGGRGANDVRITIASDASVLVECSTQDLGTGQRTLFPIIVGEVLGLEVKDITSRIGESVYGRSTPSGGSTTCPGTSPAALNAAADAKKKLFEKLAPKLGVPEADLAIDPAKPGKIIAKDKEWTWKEACAKLGMDKVQGVGDWSQGLSSQGVGGVQVAEVWVDTETGVVRCTKFWAIQDCGLIVNKLGCESQVAGGVIMGINYALFEDRIMDRHTGRQVNPDLEFYKLGGIQDMPEIVVHMVDMPERGVIGIGEPPTIGTAAAIGNAICNAIGVRVPTSPFTPDKVLAALSPNKA